ncbi:MAG: ABC transporter [Candidatus Xenobia bacterium]
MRRLALEGINKSYGSTRALQDVSLSFESGQIHALLGENGAGKSTLLKVLSGLVRPDSGRVLSEGRPLLLTSPTQALRLGIATVHQHFMLVDELTVAQNLVLAGLRQHPQQLAEEYSLSLPWSTPVAELSVGERQRVEILRALAQEAWLLLLDEPTAVLTPLEVKPLFVVLRRMVAQGRGVVFVSHKLGEVMELCDRVSVLRQGKLVSHIPSVSQTTPGELARLMVDRELEPLPLERGPVSSTPRLQLSQLAVPPRLKGVDLTVHQGEIVGLAGVSGNGQRELADALAGLSPFEGSARLDGQELAAMSIRHRLEAGLAYVPEDRQRTASILDFSLSENLILRDYPRPPLARQGVLQPGAVQQRARALVEEYSVKTSSVEAPARTLSGGNLQKLVLARELSRQPRLLVAAQPTRGVDLGATRAIHRLLLDEKARGTAILLISEDLDELRTLSDRLAVMEGGRIVGIVPPDTPPEELGLLFAGQAPTSRSCSES